MLRYKYAHEWKGKGSQVDHNIELNSLFLEDWFEIRLFDRNSQHLTVNVSAVFHSDRRYLQLL